VFSRPPPPTKAINALRDPKSVTRDSRFPDCRSTTPNSSILLSSGPPPPTSAMSRVRDPKSLAGTYCRFLLCRSSDCRSPTPNTLRGVFKLFWLFLNCFPFRYACVSNCRHQFIGLYVLESIILNFDEFYFWISLIGVPHLFEMLVMVLLIRLLMICVFYTYETCVLWFRTGGSSVRLCMTIVTYGSVRVFLAHASQESWQICPRYKADRSN